jgi:DNA-binding NtrC family response regulator
VAAVAACRRQFAPAVAFPDVRGLGERTSASSTTIRTRKYSAPSIHARSRHIDTVLSDIMMPGGISGLQLPREIRQRYPTLPIILTTGYIEAAADMADGEFMLLPKPFTLEALGDALGVPVEQDTR